MLTLRVTSFQSEALGAHGMKTFGPEGGSIGRNQSNDWVLPDPEKFISGSHARVSCRNGTYFLRDLSTNGTFINGSPQPIGNGMEMALTEGDRLQIGEYEITVTLQRADSSSVTGPTGFDLGRGGSFATGPSGARRSATGPTSPHAGAPLEFAELPSADPLDFFGDRSQPGRPPQDPGVIPDHASPLEEFYQPAPLQPPPAPSGAESAIPEDWDMTGYSGAGRRRGADPFAGGQPVRSPPPAPMPSQPAHLPEGQAGAIVALLIAAGLDPASARAAAAVPGVADNLGALLGVVVQGMLDVLKARADIKSQFRVPVTSMRPVENNPLKFSANAAQALQTLLAAHSQAYLGPVEAFTEGFRDIKAHQIAMMAGMRAAFDSLIERFDPEELAERFEKRLKRGALIKVPGKGRYWDLYRDLYEELTQDADVNFQRLFGEKFSQAYEEQMRRLTAVRR